MSALKDPAQATINGGVSYWFADAGLPSFRATLSSDIEADVCIVGAGLTGLWTAYYLKRAKPDLRIVILEQEFAGFGASGRNGGWLSDEIGGPKERYAARSGKESVVRLIRMMREAVDEVVSVAALEGIEADIKKDGMLTVARNRAQVSRAHAAIHHERAWGATEADVRLVESDELGEWTHVAGGMAATFSPHCARVHPAKLVKGLAEVVESLGITIYEQTRVREIAPRIATTDSGHVVRAPYVLRCLEGFTPGLKGSRRDWLPMNSTMIVTEPLPADALEEARWRGASTLSDFAHAYMYAQITEDGRIALGGRGIPYRFGSATDRNGVTQPRTIGDLRELLHEMIPATRSVPVAHAWCGVLAVPRDWCASVSVDHATGIGVAGGYVGNGLTTTNLAARGLADLVLKEDTEATRLPWIGRPIRKWEPEPLRWMAVNGLYAMYRAADRREFSRDLASTSWLAKVANQIAGR